MRPLLLAAALLTPALAQAQWTNRYPAVPGYSHHVYLEGYELPTLAAGPTDPAPSPDGRSVAVAARGWLWLLDLETGVARRLTNGPHVDARPAWSPDGGTLAFVRDTGTETSIVGLDLATGEERVLAGAPGLELDPAFLPDGRLIYAAAHEVGVGLHLLDPDTALGRPLALEPGLALAPSVSGERVAYIAKRGGDRVRVLDTETGEDAVVYTGAILSQTRPALSPDGQTIALTLPDEDGWELVVIGADGGPALRLLAAEAPPLAAAWSPDGTALYYAQADGAERMGLWRIPAEGGTPEAVEITTWNWDAPTGTVVVRTTMDGQPAPARVTVTDASGHPLVPETGQVWLDGETGAVYAYSPGELRFPTPAGGVRVSAVQGLETPLASAEATVASGETEAVDLALERVWDGAGWLSGDQHFHMNYGGPYALEPADLLPLLAGEGLDVAHPLVANLHTRYEDDQFWRDGARSASGATVAFGQEVRSHFFGHLGLVGTETLFNPWIWGPGYEVFSRDDRENATVTAHARAEGGIATYVHPVGARDPFAPEASGGVPVSLVADGVLGDLDGLEVVCLWTDDLGTSRLWYRLLNLGQVVVPMAGSDVMSNFYRTMAPGTARAYVRADDTEGYLSGLARGESFVTTGPLLDAQVGGVASGGVVNGGRDVTWTLKLASAVPVDRVEVVVNGEIVASEAGMAEPGRRSYTGTVALPEAGWVALRAWGDGSEGWPTMAAYPFAHTAPVWIERVGSVSPEAERQAARDLLQVLDASQARFEAAYAGVEAPMLRERFRRARAELERRAGM